MYRIFSVGYFIDQYNWSKKAERGLYLAGCLSVIAAAFLNAHRTLVNGTAMNYFCNDSVTVFPCVFAAAVFLFFKKKNTLHIKNDNSADMRDPNDDIIFSK